MDADGDYIPKSVLAGNVRSIKAWQEWKKQKAAIKRGGASTGAPSGASSS